MRIIKMTLETDDGITLVAEGAAIMNTEVNLNFGVRTLPPDGTGWIRKEHTGQRTITVTVSAMCTYWVDKKERPKRLEDQS